MTTAEVGSLRRPVEVNTLSPYLEGIVQKKLNEKVTGIALTCIECIVHWFLTTFSCCYPAYNEFYKSEVARVSIEKTGDQSVSSTNQDLPTTEDEGSSIESDQKTIQNSLPVNEVIVIRICDNQELHNSTGLDVQIRHTSDGDEIFFPSPIDKQYYKLADYIDYNLASQSNWKKLKVCLKNSKDLGVIQQDLEVLADGVYQKCGKTSFINLNDLYLYDEEEYVFVARATDRELPDDYKKVDWATNPPSPESPESITDPTPANSANTSVVSDSSAANSAVPTNPVSQEAAVVQAPVISAASVVDAVNESPSPEMVTKHTIARGGEIHNFSMAEIKLKVVPGQIYSSGQAFRQNLFLQCCVDEQYYKVLLYKAVNADPEWDSGLTLENVTDRINIRDNRYSVGFTIELCNQLYFIDGTLYERRGTNSTEYVFIAIPPARSVPFGLSPVDWTRNPPPRRGIF